MNIGMSRKYPITDIKVLYGLAAERCSFPDCKRELVIKNESGERKQVGKIAHIIAHSRNGPRADASYSDEKRDTYDNWILLCGTHHDMIDVMSGMYSVEILRNMKVEHESWVKNSLTLEVMGVGFAELEVAANAILSSEPTVINDSFAVTPPFQKMKKNNLMETTHHLLTMGLSRSPEVGRYIEAQSKLDSGYPERLKAGFRKEYNRLIGEEICSDPLFQSMLVFASGNSRNFKRQAAGLVILSHLFEICEVFEK